MGLPALKLDDAALRQARDAGMEAHRAVGDASLKPAELSELAMQRSVPQARYRLLYLTGVNCGTDHNYANLRAVDALPNVDVAYVRYTPPNQPVPGAPGHFLASNDTVSVRNFLRRYDLDIFDFTKAVLIGPDGNVVGRYENTRTQDFVNSVRARTGNARTAALAL